MWQLYSQKEYDNRRSPRLEINLYKFNSSSDGRVMGFLKMDWDSEATVQYCTYREDHRDCTNFSNPD